MERLTEKHYLAEDHYMKCSEDCNVDMDCVDCPAFDKLIERLAAYEDTGLTPEEIKDPFTEDAMINLAAQALGVEADRLRELAEADKDGRVLILPCKLGTKVYRIRYKIADYPDKPDLEIADTWFTPEYREDIGKTVFLAREEAEKALQEMEGKEEGRDE